MSIYSEIQQAFPQLTLADISDYYSYEIEPAKKIYQGKPPWRRVKSSGIKKKTRDRSLLNMAKVVCDKMAALTFSEQCDIKCSDEKYQEFVLNTLENNAFWAKLPEWFSRAFALGGGIIKLNIINDEISLDYLNADTFVPTRWNNRRILDGIFRSGYVRNGKRYSIFERRFLDENGSHIEYSVWESDSKSTLGSPVSINTIFKGTPDKTDFNSIKTPLFVYFKPAIGNNKCFDIPLGLPIFANCYDTLEEIDIVFDSLQREFILGKKRIIIPEEFIKYVFDSKSGEETRYFDADDEVYQALSGSNTDKFHITDSSVNLRVQEHLEALHNLLDILGMQLGLSSGSLAYDKSDGLKTATEVVANERDTMRTVENQKNIVTECIEELCEAIIAAYSAIHNEPIRKNTVTVSWQDNVISDDDTRIQQNIELVNAGLRSKKRALMDINGCDEENAEKELAEIAAQNSSGGDVDMILGGSDE